MSNSGWKYCCSVHHNKTLSLPVPVKIKSNANHDYEDNVNADEKDNRRFGECREGIQWEGTRWKITKLWSMLEIPGRENSTDDGLRNCVFRQVSMNIDTNWLLGERWMWCSSLWVLCTDTKRLQEVLDACRTKAGGAIKFRFLISEIDAFFRWGPKKLFGQFKKKKNQWD